MKTKTFILISIATVLIAGIFAFIVVFKPVCNKITPEEKAEITVKKFFECVKLHKTDSIGIIYPKCTFEKAINVGRISILSAEPWGDQGLYIVTCNNSHNDENGSLINSSCEFVVQTNMYDNQVLQSINSSKGLIELPLEARKFLYKTGALQDVTEDSDIADEYSTYIDFIDYAIQNTQQSLSVLAERTYSGNEYNWYLTNCPHTNARMRLSAY